MIKQDFWRISFWSCFAFEALVKDSF